MSEEEKKAIDILINEIADIVVGEYCTHCKICENEDTECYYTKAIDTVYNLINKQQQEIKEEHENWKELLHEYGVKCQEIERLKEKQDYARLEKEQLLGDSISKDKIKEKIKELSKTQAYKVGLEEYTIKILNELLEE